MPQTIDRALSHDLREGAHHLVGAPEDFDPLLALVGDARFVLIGEASHGTHEFYRIRAEITKRLIREKGLHAVAVEADWPDAYRVNRYVRGRGRRSRCHRGARRLQALPPVDVAQRRRARLRRLAARAQRRLSERPRPGRDSTGSTCTACTPRWTPCSRIFASSIPRRPRRARRAMPASTTSATTRRPTATRTAGLGLAASCETRGGRAARRAAALRGRIRAARRPGRARRSLLRGAERAARAERRALLPRDVRRPRRLVEPARPAHGRDTRGARRVPRGPRSGATPRSWCGRTTPTSAMPGPPRWARRGELNVGQLVRERYGGDAVLVGFTTYSGHGDGRVRLGRARRSARSCAPRCPAATKRCSTRWGPEHFLLDLTAPGAATSVLARPRLERAIGVIYRPETERQSHYFHASLPRQFDAVLHYDTTRAVEPLERTGLWERGEVPETYPSAL